MQDLPKGINRQWLTKAKEYIQWVKKHVSREKEVLKQFSTRLEELSSENLQKEFSNGERDKI